MKYKKILFLQLAFCLFFNVHATARDSLKIAVTTSFVDSGLADSLAKYYYDRYKKRLFFISAGTSKTLKLGEKKEVSLVIAHNQQLEEDFIKNGYSSKRVPFMYNFFVMAGPDDDPAGISGLPLKDALLKIKQTGNKYISRGDRSGTHLKEMELFKRYNIIADKSWVLESGTGMGQTLLIAYQKRAYTFADEATFDKFKDKLKMRIVVRDESLKNIYSLLVVSGFEKETAQVVEFFSGSQFREFLKKEARFFYPIN